MDTNWMRHGKSKQGHEYMAELSKDTTDPIKVNKKLPIKFHKKLINKSLMILVFRVNKFATNTSKKVEILHK